MSLLSRLKAFPDGVHTKALDPLGVAARSGPEAPHLTKACPASIDLASIGLLNLPNLSSPTLSRHFIPPPAYSSHVRQSTCRLKNSYVPHPLRTTLGILACNTTSTYPRWVRLRVRLPPPCPQAKHSPISHTFPTSAPTSFTYASSASTFSHKSYSGSNFEHGIILARCFVGFCLRWQGMWQGFS